MGKNTATPVAQKRYEGYTGYQFATALNDRQSHYIEREGDGPWTLSMADLEDELTLEDAQTLGRELEGLCEFITQLSRPNSLHRVAEPGEPDLAGRGGGL